MRKRSLRFVLRQINAPGESGGRAAALHNSAPAEQHREALVVPVGRLLIVIGVALVVVGILLGYTNFFSYLRLGRLPGDIHIKREHFRFYFPLTTSILLSLILTLILYFFRK